MNEGFIILQRKNVVEKETKTKSIDLKCPRGNGYIR